MTSSTISIHLILYFKIYEHWSILYIMIQRLDLVGDNALSSESWMFNQGDLIFMALFKFIIILLWWLACIDWICKYGTAHSCVTSNFGPSCRISKMGPNPLSRLIWLENGPLLAPFYLGPRSWGPIFMPLTERGIIIMMGLEMLLYVIQKYIFFNVKKRPLTKTHHASCLLSFVHLCSNLHFDCTHSFVWELTSPMLHLNL